MAISSNWKKENHVHQCDYYGPNFSSDHLLDEEGKCWCEPEKYEDEETGNIVWIHRKIKEEGH